MRIAFILNEFPAISETFILSQITGLIDRGHDVEIFAFRRHSSSQVPADVNRYRLLDRTSFFPRLPANFLIRVCKALGLLLYHAPRGPTTARLLFTLLMRGARNGRLIALYEASPFFGRKPYDIVHCHYGPIGLRIVPLCEIGLLQGKVITTFHGFDASRYVKQHGGSIYQPLFVSGAHFLTVSERMKDQLVNLGCEASKISVHHCGVDSSKFTYEPRGTLVAEKARLLTIGRLVEKKGVEYGLRAVRQLVESGRTVEYLIVGDGPLRRQLELLVVDLRIDTAVTFLGSKPHEEVQRLLTTAHFLLAPSVTAEDGDKEGIPVVLMEAMAAGLPVVSTLHSGIPELVIDGVSGLLAPERDVKALSTKLGYLLDHPNDWEKMGRAGRERIQGHFDVSKLNDRLVSGYENVVLGRPF